MIHGVDELWVMIKINVWFACMKYYELLTIMTVTRSVCMTSDLDDLCLHWWFEFENEYLLDSFAFMNELWCWWVMSYAENKCLICLYEVLWVADSYDSHCFCLYDFWFGRHMLKGRVITLKNKYEDLCRYKLQLNGMH